MFEANEGIRLGVGLDVPNRLGRPFVRLAVHDRRERWRSSKRLFERLLWDADNTADVAIRGEIHRKVRVDAVAIKRELDSERVGGVRRLNAREIIGRDVVEFRLDGCREPGRD
ncbi:hypothetical protein [Halosegnis marinus]|uniref:Uncharacterized protein n=1 Tax=Halosegnis marinus TaxID=3034023 RepID=A0ABD5ZTF7_9EURY|nr:hypothetical protein [Halosegnis sp. DT85]